MFVNVRLVSVRCPLSVRKVSKASFCVLSAHLKEFLDLDPFWPTNIKVVIYKERRRRPWYFFGYMGVFTRGDHCGEKNYDNLTKNDCFREEQVQIHLFWLWGKNGSKLKFLTWKSVHSNVNIDCVKGMTMKWLRMRNRSIIKFSLK